MNFTTDSRFDFSRKQVDAINSEHYTSVLDLFERACSEFAEKIAFSCLGQDISFRQIDEMSGKFAAFLRGDAGLQHGDRVALSTAQPNSVPGSGLGHSACWFGVGEHQPALYRKGIATPISR